MTFVLRMVGREIRASWQRLLFFFLCIAIGVASIVAIRSVIQNVRAGLTRETRALTGADIVVTGNRPFTEKVLERVERERHEGRVGVVAEAAELPTMVRGASGGPAKMVELRAVQGSFPLYGTLTLRDGAAYSHALLRGRGVLVRPELLTQLGLRVGDALLIGTASF